MPYVQRKGERSSDGLVSVVDGTNILPERPIRMHTNDHIALAHPQITRAVYTQTTPSRVGDLEASGRRDPKLSFPSPELYTQGKPTLNLNAVSHHAQGISGAALFARGPRIALFENQRRR